VAGLDLARPRIMGVVNVTPDSFSDGAAYFDTGAAIAHGLALAAAGADIVDVGGESTRPGAAPTDEARSDGASCRSSRRCAMPAGWCRSTAGAPA